VTLAEALGALRRGDLHLDADAVEGIDDDARRELAAFVAQSAALVGEVRRIMTEIAVEGRLGGQVVVQRPEGDWAALVVDVNQMARAVTNQIRDLSQTVMIKERIATAPAAGEIKLLIDAVNATRGTPEDVEAVAERMRAEFDVLASRAEERGDEVRRLLDERTQFFAALSHEFRTPLAVILRQADLLAADAEAIEGGPVAVDTIRSAGQDLLATVNDVLDLAKTETNALDLVLEPVDLAAVVEDLGATARTLAAAADLTFDLWITGERHVVQGDARRLRQLVRNLIDNAIKYTPPGGTVAVELASGSAIVTCHVRDTGVGFPFAERHRIFEPFYRVPGATPQRGQASSGLGLALAKRIAVAHGGAVGAFPSEQGSVFTFELPLATT
jgi:signal transduction histidine kinase